MMYLLAFAAGIVVGVVATVAGLNAATMEWYPRF